MVTHEAAKRKAQKFIIRNRHRINPHGINERVTSPLTITTHYPQFHRRAEEGLTVETSAL